MPFQGRQDLAVVQVALLDIPSTGTAGSAAAAFVLGPLDFRQDCHENAHESL
jgi:hypothetical protein